MKKTFLIILFSSFIISCSNNTTDEIPIDNTVTANITGTVDFTLDTLAVSKNITKKLWDLNENSKLEVKVSKNLTSNPYNLKLTLTVDETNPNAPVLFFISDFDRKIIPGDRYRLITTLVLFGNTTFIPGNTGGQITYLDPIGSYGFGFGSELEITIANEGATLLNNSSQILTLSGTFVYDNNNLSGLEVGKFNVVIDGNNIVDTSVF